MAKKNKDTSVPKVSRRPRFLTTLLALVIAASAVIDGFCVYDVYGRDVKGATAKAAEQNKDDAADSEEIKRVAAEREAEELAIERVRQLGEISFTPETDMVALDADQAFDVLEGCSATLGINSPREEYRIKDTVEHKDYRYFVMQQVHKDIPVYGSTVTVTAKTEGDVVDVSGTHINVPDDIPTEPDVLIDAAKKSADAYVQNTLGYGVDDYYLESNGLVYDPLSLEDVVLCYCYAVYSPSGHFLASLTVDAKTGEIAGATTFMNDESIDLTDNSLPFLIPEGQGGMPRPITVFRESDTNYLLKNEIYNIEIYVLDSSGKLNDYTANNTDLYHYDPFNETPDESAVDALYNLTQVSKFYKEKFQRDGVTNNSNVALPVFVGVREVNGVKFLDNAAMFGNSFIAITDRTTADKEFSAYLDVMGHEFTHGIVNTDSSLKFRHYKSEDARQASCQMAINEGIADVMGGFVEDYIKDSFIDNDGNDWIIAQGDKYARDIKGNTSLNVKNYTEFKTDCHDGSFYVSYPAYYMIEHGIPAETVAHMYYDLIPTLNGFSDFRSVRATIENLALNHRNAYYTSDVDDPYALTDEQFEVVMDAFDSIGIPSAYDYTDTTESSDPESDEAKADLNLNHKVKSGGKLRVYDKDDKLQKNFNVKIARKGDSEALNDTAASARRLVDEDVDNGEFTFPSDLPNGIYTVMVTQTDSKDGAMTYKKDVLINDNDDFPDTIEFYTRFNEKTREVVLVLDVSGSMSGEPIEQTRQSANNFVNTVLSASPSTKISIVTYSNSANVIIEGSNNKNELSSIINGLGSGGGTNIFDGLGYARNILDKSIAAKKMIVLMSDGEPNNGENENGDYAKPCINLAGDIKSDGTIIYSLGFFHDLSGDEKIRCQDLMKAIASDGYYFEVGNAEDAKFTVDDPENQLENAFDDIAGQVSGNKYIYIRIACPVDVIVRYDGEELNSARGSLNTRTDFGTLSFDKEDDDEKGSEDSKKSKSSDSEDDEDDEEEHDDDEVKVLRLLDGHQYEICINGTGKGKMDYTISYPNEDGEYEDVRRFKNVPITKDTLISTSTDPKVDTEMNVDTDGDGVFDLIYTAKEGSKAVLKNKNAKLIIIISLSAFIALMVIIEIILIVKRIKYNKVCHKCGAKLANAKKFCNRCGEKAIRKNIILPQKIDRPKQSKGAIITKLVLIAIFAGTTSAVVYLYRSPATTVYKQLANGKPSSAYDVYETGKVSDNALQDKYLSLVVNNYIDRADKALEKGDYTEDEFKALLDGAVMLDNDDITAKAEEYLDGFKDKSENEDSSGSGDEEASSGEIED